MRSGRTNALITVGALALLAAVGGTVAHGSNALTPSTGDVVVTVTTLPRTTPAAPRPTASATRVTTAPASTPTSAPDPARANDPAPTPAKAPAKARAVALLWTVTKVVDGDTIRVTRGGSSHKIRFIGIDTPETGQCGFTEARNALRGIIGGQRVTLTAGARDDVDRYGRLLRYVDVNGVDAGLRLVKTGYAVARYDSRDGYGAHTRETAYVRADAASSKAACVDPDTDAGTSGGTGGTGGSALAGSWPQAGDKHPCPQSRPVKGNENSMIAHEPTDRYYNITKPEQCFATMSDAESAGFRPAKV